MQLQINEWIESFRAGVGLVPPALVAVVLLAGPTVSWLLYRFIVQPRARRMRAMDLSAMWVCSKCRSVNELRMARCYRCDARPDESDLELIDPRPTGPARLTAVGPGLDLGGPGQSVAQPVSSGQEVSAGAGTPPRLTGMPYLSVLPDLVTAPDSFTLPDVAAMTELADTPERRRSPMPRESVPVGPGEPETASEQRVAVGGQGPNPDDSPAA